MDPEEQALREAFGRWLRTALTQHRITASELERHLGRQPGWILRFEAGLFGSDLGWDEGRELIEFLGESPEGLRTRLIRGDRPERF